MNPWPEILAHIGIPFAAGLVLLLVKIASATAPITWEICNDIALDLTILSVGASGGIFVNDRLLDSLTKFGMRPAIVGIAIVLGDFIPLGLLLVIRRYRAPKGFWGGAYGEPISRLAHYRVQFGCNLILWVKPIRRRAMLFVKFVAWVFGGSAVAAALLSLLVGLLIPSQGRIESRRGEAQGH